MPASLQGIGLAPGHRRTDHLPALGAEPRVRVPGVHQGLQQRRLAGAGDAGEHRQRAALPERVDGGALLGREKAMPASSIAPRSAWTESAPERSRAL